MQEMYAGIDKFKKDEASKKNDIHAQLQKITQDINKLKDYQAPPPSAPGSAG